MTKLLKVKLKTGRIRYITRIDVDDAGCSIFSYNALPYTPDNVARLHGVIHTIGEGVEIIQPTKGD